MNKKKEEPSTPDYPALHRYAVLLRPRPPFFDWLKQVHPEDAGLVDPDFWEPNLYLIPEMFNPAEEDTWLRQHFARLFAHELLQADPQEEHWPEERPFELFEQWFAAEFISTVFDMVKGPVEKG